MRALITGITGQDGSYLAELLLDKGYEVHGIIRRSSTFNTSRIDHIFDRLHLHHGDMTDGTCLRHILLKSCPTEVYNLAAQSHVKVSFECAEYTFDTIVMGTLRLLEAVRDMDKVPRVYQASTSEMFGQVTGVQDENTPLNPVSPYGIAKTAAHRLAQMHRTAYGTPVSCGILFNHESPRRGKIFVTSKVCRAAVRIEAGLQKVLELGNLDVIRDWGFAGDYVEAMWMMLQHPTPDDFVIATREGWSITQLCEIAFGMCGLRWKDYVQVSEKNKRPMDVPHLIGSHHKARQELGWEPKVKFPELIRTMVEAEWEKVQGVGEVMGGVS